MGKHLEKNVKLGMGKTARCRTGADSIWGDFESSPLEIIYYYFLVRSPIWGHFETPPPQNHFYLKAVRTPI